MKSLSTWAASAQEAIRNEQTLIKTVRRHGYQFDIKYAGDAMWLVVTWPQHHSMAFRLAFAFGDRLTIDHVKSDRGGVTMFISSISANYCVSLNFPNDKQPIVRLKTTLKAKFPLLIPFCPRDILPLTKKGSLANTCGRVYIKQKGTRTGQLFFSMTKPRTGSVLYLQNLAALNDYCQLTETTAADVVGGEWPEIGFALPPALNKPLPAAKEIIISDALLFLSDQLPAGPTETAKQFLNQLAALYPLLEKPSPVYHDWLNLGENSLQDLANHKGCWTYADKHVYLNAYVSDYKTPPEIMVQLAVLLPLIEYLNWKKENHPLIETLQSGLPAFYDDELKTIVRWLPSLENNLDQSEEQKKEGVMDSWYLHHPLLNLTRLARLGNKTAEKLLLDAIEYAIHVAQHFDYSWPVFYDMRTLNVIKAESAPGEDGERDVAGSYAHLMLEVWKLTGEKRYFNEAKRAAKKLAKIGLDIFYQANNTAFAAGAMLTLYKETQEEVYLNLSYICLASIFRNVQLWNCNYGYGKHYPSFFALYPLSDAPYTAAYEELEVYAAFTEYAKMASDIKHFLPTASLLLAEFVKYAIYRSPYYYPPMLPREMLSDDVKMGTIDSDLWVPLEDLQDGWKKSGSVGQEVYGSGICFGVIPRQYFEEPNGLFFIFVDYPVKSFRRMKRDALHLHIMGDSELTCQLFILLKKANKELKFTVETHHAQVQPIEPVEQTTTSLKFYVKGNQTIRIIWH